MPDNDFLTRAQLIGRLNVSESTVRRWERAGLPVIRVGDRGKRYNLQIVTAWLSASRETGKPCQSGRIERAESTLASCLKGGEFIDACRRAQLRVVPKK
jgi:phage terminase Nu1 subunit (DNA packaging protein)